MSFIFTEQDMEGNGGGTEKAKAGTYIAKVTNAEFISKDGKKPFLKLWFNDAESGSFLCTDRIWLTQAARGISAKKLKTLGVPKRKDGDYEATEDNLRNLRVSIRIIVDPQNSDFMVVDDKFGFFGYEAEEAGDVEEDDVPF